MSRRTLLRVLTAGLLSCGVMAIGSGPVGAHADLLGTEPGYGAVLEAAPDRVLIRYDRPVEVRGARVQLVGSAGAVAVGEVVHASEDGSEVAVSLPELDGGGYVLTWFLFGRDGDVMGGELAFAVAAEAAPEEPAPVPGGVAPPGQPPAFTPLSQAEDAARLAGFMSLAVLVGGVTFVAGLWPAGAGLRRTRVLLWGALGGAVVANTAALGLKGAAVGGQSALAAFSPGALTALSGTHPGQVLTARLGFLALAVPVVAYLTVAPQRARRSHRWVTGAAVSGAGVLATHGLLSHAYTRGPLASALDALHLGAVTVWLGGLVVLAAVVLPRRRRAELALLVPRWSRLAFASMATAVMAGTALLVLLSPRWTALPTSGYGQVLAVKLALVAALLVAASRARRFVRRRLPHLTPPAPGQPDAAPSPAARPLPVAVGAAHPAASPPAATATPGRAPTPAARPPGAPNGHHPGPGSDTLDPAPLRPFVTAVTAELCIAASILAATTILVSRLLPE